MKKTTEKFVEEAKAIPGNAEHYNYDDVEYINSITKIEIYCNIHKIYFSQTPCDHLRGCGCRLCFRDRYTYTNETFTNKANIKHDFKYDYSNIDYKGAAQEVEIICPYHGSFWQLAYVHLQGHGCSDCKAEKLKLIKSSDTGQFIIRSEKIYGKEHYNYDKAGYIGAHVDVQIFCNIHKEYFWQTPNNHLRGHGCPQCGLGKTKEALAMTPEEFVARSNIKHDYKYDYSQINYLGQHTDVDIICPIHGPFPQRPANHLQGQGCPRCKYNISKPETAWLDSLNIPNDKKHRNVFLKIGNKRFKVDGFDPITNTIYEFNGDFWHGNPKKFNPEDVNAANKKTFGELYNKTLEKEQILKSAGYNVISIWEADFKPSNS